MRFDHYEGLTPRARGFIGRRVQVQETVRRVHPDGRVQEFVRDRIPACVKIERIARIKGSYKKVAGYLHQYTMLDGHVYREFVQQQPWTGGPHYFIALVNDKGVVLRNSWWSKEQMQKTLDLEMSQTRALHAVLFP